MSFFHPARRLELCQARPDRKCCAVAESYGVLLYCNTFFRKRDTCDHRKPGVCVPTAEALPQGLRRELSTGSRPRGAEGKRTLSITDADKLSAIFDAFGADRGATLSHHINFGVIEEDCCRASFIRGAFLAGGSVTDPEKRYHLELATSHRSVSREAYSILLDMGFSPKRRRSAPETACSTSSRPTPLQTSSRRSAQAAQPWTS